MAGKREKRLRRERDAALEDLRKAKADAQFWHEAHSAAASELARERGTSLDYGPVLIVEEDEPDEIAYYDNEELCDQCGSFVAIVLKRDGHEQYVAWDRMKPCPEDLWKKVGFDPTRSLLGEDQTPNSSGVS